MLFEGEYKPRESVIVRRLVEFSEDDAAYIAALKVLGTLGPLEVVSGPLDTVTLRSIIESPMTIEQEFALWRYNRKHFYASQI